MAAAGGMLVTVHAAYLHSLAVEAQLSAHDVKVAETNLLHHALRLVSRSIEKPDGEVVECGDAVVPGLHVGHLHLEPDEPVALPEPLLLP